MKKPSPLYKAGDKVVSRFLNHLGEFAVIEGEPQWNGAAWIYEFENGEGFTCSEKELSLYAEPTTEPIRIATREEVDDLKRAWANDPCFDLYIAGDPEDASLDPYKDELIAYTAEMEAKWEKARQESLTHRWELVEKKNLTYRMKVFGGWIVRFESSNGVEAYNLSSVFIPDPKHEWEVFVPEVSNG